MIRLSTVSNPALPTLVACWPASSKLVVIAVWCACPHFSVLPCSICRCIPHTQVTSAFTNLSETLLHVCTHVVDCMCCQVAPIHDPSTLRVCDCVPLAGLVSWHSGCDICCDICLWVIGGENLRRVFFVT